MHMWLMLMLMLQICWMLWRQALRGRQRGDSVVLFVVLGVTVIIAHVIATHAVVVTVVFVGLLLLLFLLVQRITAVVVVIVVVVVAGTSC